MSWGGRPGCTRRVLPIRQLTPERPAYTKLSQEYVARQPCLMEQQWFDREFSLAGSVMNLIDESEIAIVDVNQLTADLQLATTVEDWSPTAKVTELSVPAKLSDGFGIESIPVVDSYVPVAVRMAGSLDSRSAQGDRLDGG